MANAEFCCMRPEICDNYIFLRKRMRRMQPNKHIRNLAIPRYKTTLKVAKPKCRKFRIDIEKYYPDRVVGTRTEQLAFVSTKKLNEFKETWGHLFPWRRIASINRHFRKSLFSMYSRLYNVQAPRPPERKLAWSKEDWEAHAPLIKKLAAPKRELKVPPPPRRCKPLSAFRRMNKLATPKKYPPEEPVEWKFTPEMKNYVPSKRVKAIALPKDVAEDIHYRELPIKIPKSALKYKPSARTKALSTAQEKKGAVSDLKDDPFSISKNALKAKPSARTKELAEPKEYEEIKERSQVISPAALKAKASPRIIELAKEKHRREKVVK
ncbi:hypothetical protein ACFFRR_007050 [Megaselia abdita]